MNENVTSRVLRLCLAIVVALVAFFVLTFALGRVTQAAMAPQTALIVDNADDAGAGSLRQAILDANAMPGADVIEIAVAGTVNLQSPLPLITGPVTIQGPGAALFGVDGQTLYRVLDIAAVDVTISALTVQHGAASGADPNGAGIRSRGDLSLSHVRVLSNTAQGSGGGLNVSGHLTLTNSLFQNNRSTNNVGGALRTNSIAIISDTQFLDNSSQGDGGAVFALGENVITGARFQENHCLASSCDGGGLFGFSRTTVQDSHFMSNTAQDDGGGAYIAGVVTVTNGLFQNNHSVTSSGGGLGAQDRAVVQTTQFLSNTARGSGGGMSIFGSLVIRDALLLDNHSTNSQGGGLNAQGDLEVDGVQFIGNTAREGGALAAGAAIEVITGTVGITNTIVASHTVGISSTGATVFQDYNLFFGNGVDVQGPVSGGSNGLVADPLLLAPGQGQYHLSSASPAINAGADVGVTSDFDGDMRPFGGGFDVGFDEAMFNLPDYTIYLPIIRK